MSNPTYVLVTPVRNEEATIGITIESVITQSHQPVEWVIVSDGSTDRTDEIIERYAKQYPFIRPLRLGERPQRSFSSVVFATQAGIEHLSYQDYGFIGLLDGDIRFPSDYYSAILSKFDANSQLGLAGGLVIDCIGGKRIRHPQAIHDVAGAVQFFRRSCFEALGGLTAIPEGGWDAITCLQARMHGFDTRTFPEIEVDHLKPRNISEGNVPRRHFFLGVRDYALGNHPLFETLKCLRRCFGNPLLVGGISRFGGYVWCSISRRDRSLSKELISHIRNEQLRRMLRFGPGRFIRSAAAHTAAAFHIFDAPPMNAAGIAFIHSFPRQIPTRR